MSRAFHSTRPASSMRPPAPASQKQNAAPEKENKSKRTRPTKIDRITIENTFRCRVIRAVSPHHLYLRLVTDITRDLQWACPHKLNLIPENEQIRVGSYLMAPLKEELYARAVVQKVNLQFVLVEFIDEGTYAWVHRDTLVVMEDDLFYHPKQAVFASLFGFDLRTRSLQAELFDDDEDGHNGKKEGPFWTAEHVKILDQILSRYSDFEVRYVRRKGHAVPRWDQPIKVELFGIDDGGKLDAIAPRFAEEARHLGVVYMRDACLADHLRHYITEDEVYQPLNVDAIAPWRMKISGYGEDGKEIWGERKGDQIAPKGYLVAEKVFDEEFTVRPGRAIPTPTVKTFTMDAIRDDFADEQGRVNMFVVPKKDLSPLEFYTIPLKYSPTVQPDLNCSKALKEVMDERRKFTEALNTFYIKRHNQKKPEYYMLLMAICMRHATYAIYETPPSESALAARYRRVLLVDFILVSKGFENESDPNCWMVKVVFLDFGGTEMVPLTSLLQIHSKHCKQLPFTVQLRCPVGGVTVPDEKCEQRLSAIFKAVVPTDFVISAQLSDGGDPPTSVVDPNVAHVRPNVLMAEHLREADRVEELDSSAAIQFQRAQDEADGSDKFLRVKKVGFGKKKRLVFEWSTVEEEVEPEVEPDKEIRRPQTAMAQHQSDDWSMFMDEDADDFDDALDPRDPNDFVGDLTTLIKSINLDIWRDYGRKELERMRTLLEEGKLHEDHGAQLLLKYFFPRYHKMLSHLLSSGEHKNPDIAAWYLFWKARIPEVLLKRGDVKDQLLIALRSMFYSLQNARVKHRTPSAPKRRQIPIPTPDLKRMSIAKWMEILAAQHDIAFAPISGKRHESNQLYRFGDERIYFLDKVVYVFDFEKKRYSPISPGALVNRCA